MSLKSSDMSLYVVIKTTAIVVRGALILAVAIRDSENVNAELTETIKFLSTNLTVIESMLKNLLNFAQRVSTQDEIFLCGNVELLQSSINDAKSVLDGVQRDRNLVQRVFMRKEYYRRQLQEISKHLKNSLMVIQGALPTIKRLEIPGREFPDFRKLFPNQADRDISLYDFMVVRNSFNSVISINFQDFDVDNCACYMKLCNQQIFFSYRLRIWSASYAKSTDSEQCQNECKEEIQQLENSNPIEDPSIVCAGLPTALSALPDEPSNTHQQLDFSEFFMSHDDIRGVALTQLIMYIATKGQITVVSLAKRQIIAQHGIAGDGSNLFDHISYIYVPLNDQTSLYIIDRGENAVHQYKIDDSGRCFEYIRRYVVIAHVNQQYNLISCAIFHRHLYVSDAANNCLHIFPINGGRQSTYLADTSMTPFSPGSLCTHGKYLYVANCSPTSPGILVLNEECQPVDWFRHRSLTEILAIDIEPSMNELYVLTAMTTENDNDAVKKRPVIVSMDLTIHAVD